MIPSPKPNHKVTPGEATDKMRVLFQHVQDANRLNDQLRSHLRSQSVPLGHFKLSTLKSTETHSASRWMQRLIHDRYSSIHAPDILDAQTVADTNVDLKAKVRQLERQVAWYQRRDAIYGKILLLRGRFSTKDQLRFVAVIALFVILLFYALD
jgi:hypothetical protein